MAIYLDLGLAENEVADQSLINGQIGMEDKRSRHAATENTPPHTHTHTPCAPLSGMIKYVNYAQSVYENLCSNFLPRSFEQMEISDLAQIHA